MNINISQWVLDDLREIASESDQSLTSYIKGLLKTHVETHKAERADSYRIGKQDEKLHVQTERLHNRR